MKATCNYVFMVVPGGAGFLPSTVVRNYPSSTSAVVDMFMSFCTGMRRVVHISTHANTDNHHLSCEIISHLRSVVCPHAASREQLPE